MAWSRAHPSEAALLLNGAEEFGRAGWSQEHRARADRGNERVFARLGMVGAGLGLTGPEGRARIVLTLIDLPLATVRRPLRAGHPLPAEGLAEDCAAALLVRARRGRAGRVRAGPGPGRARHPPPDARHRRVGQGR
ncbi:hypothetical protein [Streptomyces sp. NPDC051704]|uniref:hypothetical protein n=1 Tax=Streptomyces sp. NPDC051704 TaxID=3365671 RepID=UPI0037AD1D21